MVHRLPESPLTHSQSYYWLQFIQIPEGERARANVAMLVDLPTDTTFALAGTALLTLVRRHQGLRSRVGVGDSGEVRQQWRDDVQIDLAVRTVSPFSSEGVKQIVEDELRAPLVLDVARPQRALLFMDGTSARVLVLVMSHVFADASTESLLRDEAARMIASMRAGEQPEAGIPQPSQNSDIAEAERSIESRQRSAAALVHWRALLGSKPNVSFPYRPPADDGPRHHAVIFTARNFAATVAAASRNAGVIEGSLLLGVLALVIGRYTGLRESGWQIPFSKLVRTPTAHVVGPNVQKGFLAVAEGAGTSLFEFLRTVQGRMLQAHVNADYDEFALLDQRLAVESERRTAVWFDCYFECVLERTHPEIHAGHAREPGTIERLSDGHTRFLNLWPFAIKIRGGPDLVVRLTAERRAIGADDAAAVLQMFEQIIMACADGRNLSCEDIDLLMTARGWPRRPHWNILPSRNLRVDLDATRRAVESFPGVRSAELTVAHAGDGAGEVISCAVEPANTKIRDEEIVEDLFARLGDQPGLVVPDVFHLRAVPACPPGPEADESGTTPVNRAIGNRDDGVEALALAVSTANGIEDLDPGRSYVGGGGRMVRVPLVNQLLCRSGWRELPLHLFIGHRSIRTIARNMSRRRDGERDPGRGDEV